jgi:hypothetical protein
MIALLYLSLFSDRYHFLSLLLPYLIAFGAYLLIFNRIRLNTSKILALTVLIRLATFFSEPLLSTDYYRFLWDGTIANSNPQMVFSYTPREFLYQPNSISGVDQSLFDQLNSQEYYTVYPPVCQFMWAMTVSLSGSDTGVFVFWLRLWMVLFEVGTVFFIILILKKLRKPIETSLLYVLNPLIIIELSGNLHPEGFMIFFMSIAMFFLVSFVEKTNGGFDNSDPTFSKDQNFNSKWLLFAISAGAFGLAISTKLIPLMFLPLLIPIIGWWKSFVFGLISVGLTLFFFTPFVSLEWLQNIGHSLDLYFRQFEFNASFYYVLRELSSLIRGYNEIDFIGPILAACTIVYISIRSFIPAFRQKLFLSMLLVSTIHILFSTTVHPWYLILPLFLSVFTERRYVVYWSFLIVLSYSHYGPGVWKEKYTLIAAEYILLILFIFIEKSFSERSRPEVSPL